MKIPTLRLRPSRMDCAMICPGSHYPEEGEPLIEIVGDDASPIGKAGHEYLSQYVKTGEFPDMESIALKYKVTVDQIKFVCFAAREFFDTLVETYDVEAWDSEVGVATDPILPGPEFSDDDAFALEGTGDVVGITRDKTTGIVADLKTGFVNFPHKHQVKCYAKGVRDKLRRYGIEIERVIGLIGWARDREIQVFEWTAGELDDYADEIVKTICEWDGVKYTVGAHCMFCRRHASCKARALELRSGYRLMLVDVEDDKHDLDVVSGETFATAWEMSKLIPNVVEQWRARIKERIRTTGPIDMGNGKVLDVVERNIAAEIDTVEAAKVLKAGFAFSDDDVLSVCKIGKKDMEDLIGSRAPRGQKGKAKQAVVEALKEKGALVPRTSPTLTVKDAPKLWIESERKKHKEERRARNDGA